MAPQLSEDEIDDLIYCARAGEDAELMETVNALAEREKVAPAVILMAGKDQRQSTVLHMATGNGHLGTFLRSLNLAITILGLKSSEYAPAGLADATAN